MGSTSLISEVNLGSVPQGNHTKVEEDGTITLHGNATVWDDLKFPASMQRQGATTKPDFDFTNVGLLFPQNDPTEVVYINCQMPHSYKTGSSIYPHIHFIQTSSSVPVFKMQYRWYDNGSVVPGVFTTITTSVLKFPYTSGSILQVLKFPAITNPGLVELSSMLDIKIYREDNVVTGDVLVKEFDIHIELDGLGSHTEVVK